MNLIGKKGGWSEEEDRLLLEVSFLVQRLEFPEDQPMNGTTLLIDASSRPSLWLNAISYMV